MEKESKGFMQIIFAGMLAGFIPILVRFGENLGPYNLAFFKVLIPAILLGVFFLIYKKKLSPLKYEKKKMILFGAIHGFIILGYFVAIQFLTIASAVLLMYLFPFWMIIFSYFILGERLNKRVSFALILGLFGMIILLSPETFFLKESFLGSLAGLLAGMGAGLVYVLSKTFKNYNKISLTFWQNLIAIPFVLPLLFISFPRFTSLDFFIVLVLGLIGVFSFILVFKGLQKTKANQGGVVMFLQIFFPIILAFFIFKEIPSVSTIFGGILILFGVFLIVFRKK